jgi:transposase-like protein
MKEEVMMIGHCWSCKRDVVILKGFSYHDKSEPMCPKCKQFHKLGWKSKWFTGEVWIIDEKRI